MATREDQEEDLKAGIPLSVAQKSAELLLCVPGVSYLLLSCKQWRAKGFLSLS